MTVLAIDPGRDKCGLAVVAATGEMLARCIVARGEMPDVVPALVAQHSIAHIVLGDSTTSRQLRDQLHIWLPALPVTLVDESGSTLEARELYWQA
ncbi:MAG: pre-16S rRNA-processing nuclease YqgF, partial [Armatimonadota bacterium]|nr:pre-16S rRNA-processing nuclease YqgF [Armatimonadota bacterium]